MPSLADLFFLLIFVGCLQWSVAMISIDGDPARQLRLGEYILATGTAPRVDLFSHARAGEPFVPYEWLAEVVNAASVRAFGLAGMAIAYSALIAATHAILYVLLRGRGHGVLLSAGVTLATASVTWITWSARPHVYTMLGLVLCWGILDHWYRSSSRLGDTPATTSSSQLWLLPPLFAVWANFHGGFLIGWIMIGAYLGADVLRWLAAAPGSAAAGARVRALALPALACLAVVVLNPAGLGMYEHVFGHLGHRYTLDRTNEFVSPNFHNDWTRPFLAALLAMLAALIWSRRRPALHEGGLLIVLTFFALYSLRNISVYALLTAGTLAAQLQELVMPPGRWGTIVCRLGGWLGPRDAAAARSEALSPRGVWALSGVALACLLASTQLRSGQTPLGITFDPTVLPVAAADAMIANPPEGKGFHDQGWGGYLLYRLWPSQRVYIDGQTDFYGDELVAEYDRVVELHEGWAEVLDRRDIRWVLYATGSPLVERLRQTEGWRVTYTDPRATLLVRDAAGRPNSAAPERP